MGKGGAPAPWKCCKVFCALTVTVKRSVDQLFMHYFHNFWTVGAVHLVVLACVLRATTKKVNFFEEKVHSRENLGYAMNLPNPGKILRAPMAA